MEVTGRSQHQHGDHRRQEHAQVLTRNARCLCNCTCELQWGDGIHSFPLSDLTRVHWRSEKWAFALLWGFQIQRKCTQGINYRGVAIKESQLRLGLTGRKRNQVSWWNRASGNGCPWHSLFLWVLKSCYFPKKLLQPPLFGNDFT